MTEYHPVEQPGEIPLRAREDAMGAYLMMFASIGAGLPLPVLNLIASIIYYYVNQSKGRFVDFHLKQSLFSQIPVTLLNAVAVFWAIRIFFFDHFAITQTFTGFLIAVGLANLIYFAFSIVAAVKARKGRMYYFIFFGKLSYHLAYQVKPEKSQTEAVNMPPKM